jgi:hypothetical protein
MSTWIRRGLEACIEIHGGAERGASLSKSLRCRIGLSSVGYHVQVLVLAISRWLSDSPWSLGACHLAVAVSRAFKIQTSDVQCYKINFLPFLQPWLDHLQCFAHGLKM